MVWLPSAVPILCRLSKVRLDALWEFRTAERPMKGHARSSCWAAADMEHVFSGHLGRPVAHVLGDRTGHNQPQGDCQRDDHHANGGGQAKTAVVQKAEQRGKDD
jgi:hypothetical protein